MDPATSGATVGRRGQEGKIHSGSLKLSTICHVRFRVRHLLDLLAAHCDLLHGGHVASQLPANHLDGVRLDGLVDCQQLLVVDPVVSLVVFASDDGGVSLGHEVLEHGNAGLSVKVAAVLSGVRDDLVHLVELASCDGVGDEGRLVEGLVVSALRLHACGHHFLEGQLDTGLDHSHHDDSVVEIFLLRDGHVACRGHLEASLCGLLPPLQQVRVVVVPVLHHDPGKFAGDDVVLMLHVERSQDVLELFGQLEALDLRGVVEAVHHAGDAAVLQSLCDGLPAILDELGCVAWVHALLHHLVEAEHGTGLEHAAEDGLLAHQVTLHFSDEGAQQDSGPVTASGRSVGLCDLKTLLLGIVFGVDSDERWHSEASLVLLPDLGTRALGRHHDDGDVVADLHTLLNDVEAVAVGEGGALLHQRHHLGDHRGVLLVGSQIENDVSLRNELLVSADLEAVAAGVDVARALALDGLGPQRVADVAAGVPDVQTLVQALSSTSDNDELLILNLLHAILELVPGHEAACAQLLELLRVAQRVEVVGALVAAEASGEGAHLLVVCFVGKGKRFQEWGVGERKGLVVGPDEIRWWGG
mmetsp:Transcript_35246/g.76044  ORF Transcript_35246/g.76044 Transcript_35246/m.76044 type:complete len:585 (+) Transcript_35246:216-1970(+)